MPIGLNLVASRFGTRNAGPVDMGGGPNLVERSIFSSNAPTLPFSQWYVPGTGSPAVSTSDAIGTCGLAYPAPYDLDTMGAEGAAIKAREGGKRYVWLFWEDHPGNFAGSSGLFVGYSHDPQTWPDPAGLRIIHDVQNKWTGTDKLGQSQTNSYLYWVPYLVHNPDSAGDKFFIYCEMQPHQLGLLTSSDLLSTTIPSNGPVIPVTLPYAGGWTSFGRPKRLGVNNWEVYTLGKANGTPTNLVYYKYTSTNGLDWTPDYSKIVAGAGPYTTIAGQKYLLVREDGDPNSYISLLAVDSDNVSLGAYTRISAGFGSNGVNIRTAYPGETYLGWVDGYEEDGILTIYAGRGFPISAHTGTNTGNYRKNFPSFYTITASVSGSPAGPFVLDVQSVPPGMPPLSIGFKSFQWGFGRTISGYGTGVGGVGTYFLSGDIGNISLSSMEVMTNGGTWQTWVDHYRVITDPVAAANAAPLGVKVDCHNGIVTIKLNDCLPHNNYRAYYGSSAGSQPTLVGDFTGNTISFPLASNALQFVKVVTMNGGVEQKFRVVSVYCSNYEMMANRHVHRFLDMGGDITKIDIPWVATCCGWLTSNDAWKYIQWWPDVRFGYTLNGSGFISKVFCLGTTYLGRGGDYTPTTSNSFPSTSSNTSYSANGFRGTTPCWVNNSGAARGYFGNGRANNIQRWVEMTVMAAYQRPNTSGPATFLGWGEFTGFYFQQAAGSSGNVNFAVVTDKVGAFQTFTTATAPFSNGTAPHVAIGVLDATSLTCYLDGVAGTPQSAGVMGGNYNINIDTVIRGDYTDDVVNQQTCKILVSGCVNSRFNLAARTITSSDNHAQCAFAALGVFNYGFPAPLALSWGALYS